MIPNPKFIFLTLGILFVIAVGGFFLILFGILSQGPQPTPEPQPQISSAEDEEAERAKVLEEETIRQAKEAIVLAEQAISEVQEYLLLRSFDTAQDRQAQGQGVGARKRTVETKNTGLSISTGGEKVKGVYMTGLIAAGHGSVARSLRDSIEDLVLTTELNAIVIDVKETEGPYIPDSLVKFVEGLKKNNIWTIARVVTFADASLMQEKPELYLKSKTTGGFWRDNGGRYWLDPASPETQDYLIGFSKQIIDLGFDELQYDYIRFPTDGSLVDIMYPAYDGRSKEEVLANFSARLSEELRDYKPDIILSIDLFGLVAVKKSLPEIGQNIADSARYFDYLSFMLYPSHFYGGFEVPPDSARGLSALYFPYESADINQVASSRPYEVVYRSVLSAADYITSSAVDSAYDGAGRIRPFLQDFSLQFDTRRGIIYDEEKVRLQIKAAEDAGASGWLLWNPRNVYTREVPRLDMKVEP